MNCDVTAAKKQEKRLRVKAGENGESRIVILASS
jgi:hypothetical protein